MMSINGESPGFKLFGKTIVSSSKDIISQEDGVGNIVAEEARGGPEESTSSTAATTLKTSKRAPPPPHLSCPRCRSKETKFCYYNNYSVNQPRHFCKACHRYWTAGGVLRNVPVGAGRRKNRPLPISTSQEGEGEGEGEEEGCGLVVGRDWRGGSSPDPAKSTFTNVDNYLIS